jgi:hypothetical protein
VWSHMIRIRRIPRRGGKINYMKSLIGHACELQQRRARMNFLPISLMGWIHWMFSLSGCSIFPNSTRYTPLIQC